MGVYGWQHRKLVSGIITFSLTASNFTAKTTYDIGVKRVSGSGVVHILY